MGAGMDLGVTALAVYNGELIAGGDFTTAGGVTCHHIARWDGSAWQPLGFGLDHAAVNALTIYNGELIGGGAFWLADGVMCRHIARWDGSTWRPLGPGMNGGGVAAVYALTAFANELIAGGSFTTAGDYVSCYWARWACTPCLADLNCDGLIDFADINPFVAQLSNFNAWQAEFPGCPPQNGDINGDGTYGQWSFGDINPFVDLLASGQGPCP